MQVIVELVSLIPLTAKLTDSRTGILCCFRLTDDYRVSGKVA
jgi:hypothetical protein